MALTKDQKKKILDDLKEKLEKQKALIFVDFTGLKVKNLSDLRKKLKAAANELKVAKKTLFNLAFKEKGLEMKTKELQGEIALVFGYEDYMSPAKMVYQFSKDNPNIKILGGFIENEYKEAEEIITLAQLPSQEVLLAQLVGSISAPVSNFINVLQGNIKGLINVLAKAKT